MFKPEQIATELLQGTTNTFELNEEHRSEIKALTTSGVHDLPFQESTVYDLSISSAGQLNIPVVGSVSGGTNRRVVVLERRAYRKNPTADGVEFLGYAIRLVVTVNKLDGSMKISLPFLAASAEVGMIEGKWLLQVVGLKGPKIDESALPPSELSVETFVLAKQSLTNLIAAVNDPTTTLDEQQIFLDQTEAQKARKAQFAIGSTYGLSSLERRWKLQDALQRIDGAQQQVIDAVTDVYRDFAGIQNPQEVPSPIIQKDARDLLDQVISGPR